MFHRPLDLRRPVALAAVMVYLTLPLGARQSARPQSQTTFRSGIELVQIDVVVVDATGRHIRGLKAEDFQITDRKKPQTIAAFEEVTHARPAPRAEAAPAALARLDVAGNQTAAAGRLVVLVIDDLHIWQGRTDTAKQIARGVLDKLGADASMAVLFTSGDRSTQVTEDRSLLRAAVDTLKGRKRMRRPTSAVDKQKMAAGGGEAGRSFAEIQEAQDASVQDFADNMSKFKTLEDAARMLGEGDARRKAFVLVSEGLARNPTGIFGMREPGAAPEGGAEYAATADAAATMATRPVSHHDFALIDMMEAMRLANVATYAIDPRGEISAQEVAIELHPEPIDGDPAFRWNNPLRQAQDGLATVAEASGGFAVVNSDDFTAGVDRILDDLDHYYLLGFYPADARGTDFRPLNVQLPGHQDLRVRFRRGYRAGGAPKPAATGEPLTALSAGVLPNTGLALRLSAVPVAIESGDETRVVVTLEVSADRAALQDPDGRLRDELTYEILAVDERRTRVTRAGGITARATLSPAGGDPPTVAIYQILDTVVLPPGVFQLRVSAQSLRLGKGGSVYLNIDVPDFRGPDGVMGGIALGYAAGARVATVTAVRPPTPAQRAARMPVVAPPPPLPFAPTLDRAFAARETLRVYFELWAPEKQAAPITGRLDIVAAGGGVLSSLAFTADERGRVDVALPLGNLTPGAYLLRATVTSGARETSRDVAFSITDGR